MGVKKSGHYSTYPETPKNVTCICPGCKKEHKKKMWWTGEGTPRFFCPTCRYAADVDVSGTEYAVIIKK